MGAIKMTNKEKASKQRKILLILRNLLLVFAVFYLVFLVFNNYFGQDENKLELYFATADAASLQIELRERNNDADLYLQIFRELNSGPDNKNLEKTIPPEAELLNYKIENKIIELNFNQEFKDNHWGGSSGELLTVYSLVNSYTSRSEIKAVQIIIEGQKMETLAGHLDLSQPLEFNKRLTQSKD